MRLISSFICSRRFLSSAPSGSSISSRSGSNTSARAKRHALLLAAGELPRQARSSPSRRTRRNAPRTFASISARGCRRILSGNADVVDYSHVRKQRVVLEHHADVALFGGEARDRARRRA